MKVLVFVQERRRKKELEFFVGALDKDTNGEDLKPNSLAQVVNSYEYQVGGLKVKFAG